MSKPVFQLELVDQLRKSFARDDEMAFDEVLALSGETFRSHKHRRTFRAEIDGRSYFIKIHGHTSWREILKNNARGRMPTLTAVPEVRAINRLHELGTPTMQVAGWGVRGRSPARLESFLITEALTDFVHLDDVIGRWADLPRQQQTRLVRQALAETAAIARTMHTHGMNHRDFYLCHFMLPQRAWADIKRGESLGLHVIDLHRAQMRVSTPVRWAVKDVSGLLFSALDAPITLRDCWRWLAMYDDQPRRDAMAGRRWWKRWVMRRAVSLYRSEHGRPPRLPDGLASSA